MNDSRAFSPTGSPRGRVCWILFAGAGLAVCSLAGCESGSSSAPTATGPRLATPASPGAAGGPGAAPSTTGAPAQRPAAIVAGTPIAWDELRPAMVEAAGAAALEEAALDALLRQELAARGVRWSDLDIERERSQLLAQLRESAPRSSRRAGEADADFAVRLLEELRAVRGLGPTRFEGYLRRNAALRLLVADRVTTSDATLRQAYTLRYGPRVTARLITAPTLDRIVEAGQRLDAGEPFPEVAALLSTDESASRGGRLEPISLADPTYPQSLRTALGALRDGEWSNPISLDNGFAIVLREGERTPPDAPTLAQARDALADETRARQERILMGEKARELLTGARITIFDAGLQRAWRQRAGE